MAGMQSAREAAMQRRCHTAWQRELAAVGAAQVARQLAVEAAVAAAAAERQAAAATAQNLYVKAAAATARAGEIAAAAAPPATPPAAPPSPEEDGPSANRTEAERFLIHDSWKFRKRKIIELEEEVAQSKAALLLSCVCYRLRSPYFILRFTFSFSNKTYSQLKHVFADV